MIGDERALEGKWSFRTILHCLRNRNYSSGGVDGRDLEEALGSFTDREFEHPSREPCLVECHHSVCLFATITEGRAAHNVTRGLCTCRKSLEILMSENPVCLRLSLISSSKSHFADGQRKYDN
jgi:hypothetical protein